MNVKNSAAIPSSSSFAVATENGTYEYSVHGQVAASDPNHPNPYLFTGRRFDRETGLYYYRARYYNPYIGRFLQTDPVGYGDGINWYLYCRNNPLAYTDPSGLVADPNLRILFYDGNDICDVEAADDDYLSYRFDLNEAIKLGMTPTEYVLHIINTVQDWYDGTYEWDQVTIAEVYFLAHGGHGTNRNDELSVWINLGGERLYSDTDKAKAFFRNLGSALDYNHGGGAIIHLRSCYAGMANSEGERPLLQTAALYSGHSVTGCDWEVKGYNTELRGPDYRYEGTVWMASVNMETKKVEYSKYWTYIPVISEGLELIIPPPY